MKRTRKNADAVEDPVLSRVRQLCLALPGTTETISWGHPNFRTKKGIFVTYEYIKDQPSIAFRLEPDEVQHFLRMKGFFATPYGRGCWVSMGAGGRLSWKLIAALVRKSHGMVM